MLNIKMQYISSLIKLYLNDLNYALKKVIYLKK